MQFLFILLLNAAVLCVLHFHLLDPWSILLLCPTGDVHAWVQVQGVRLWELLCDLLIHCVPAAGVGPGLVPRPHKGGTSYEGQPSQEDKALVTLRAQAHWRYGTKNGVFWILSVSVLWLHIYWTRIDPFGLLRVLVSVVVMVCYFLLVTVVLRALTASKRIL